MLPYLALMHISEHVTCTKPVSSPASAVANAGGTRTCIHTPGAALRPSDITPELCDSLLDDAKLVYFDGRLTEAALVVAHAAKHANIPILVEAERLRPDLDMLMAPADYLVTSRNFPEDWTGEENIGDAMLATMLRLPGIQWMVRTARRGWQLQAVNSSKTFSFCTQLLHTPAYIMVSPRGATVVTTGCRRSRDAHRCV